MKKIKISPSLMCADFLELKKDLDIFRANKIDLLHIDIMDGHYVPNFTLGVNFCKTVSAYSDIPLDIHLMIENVDTYIPSFSFNKNSIISIHPEVSYHPLRSIQLIKDNGLKAGIAVDPSISLEEVKYQMLNVNYTEAVRGLETSNQQFDYSDDKTLALVIEYGKVAENSLSSDIASKAKQLFNELKEIENRIRGSLQEILERCDYIGPSCRQCPIR